MKIAALIACMFAAVVPGMAAQQGFSPGTYTPQYNFRHEQRWGFGLELSLGGGIAAIGEEASFNQPHSLTGLYYGFGAAVYFSRSKIQLCRKINTFIGEYSAYQESLDTFVTFLMVLIPPLHAMAPVTVSHQFTGIEYTHFFRSGWYISVAGGISSVYMKHTLNNSSVAPGICIGTGFRLRESIKFATEIMYTPPMNDLSAHAVSLLAGFKVPIVYFTRWR